MSWKKSDKLMDTIKHYSGFPATGVSLRQMVQFGESPSTGVLYIPSFLGLYTSLFSPALADSGVSN